MRTNSLPIRDDTYSFRENINGEAPKFASTISPVDCMLMAGKNGREGLELSENDSSPIELPFLVKKIPLDS
jgi:hypothetical protein